MRHVFPEIVISTQPHDTLYFCAHNKEELFEISLKILKMNFDNKCYPEPVYVPDSFEKYFEDTTGICLNEFQKMIDCEKVNYNQKFIDLLKRTSLYDLEAQIEDQYKSLKRVNRFYEDVVKAIKDEDGKAAFRLLKFRSDYGYESETLQFRRCENL